MQGPPGLGTLTSFGRLVGTLPMAMVVICDRVRHRDRWSELSVSATSSSDGRRWCCNWRGCKKEGVWLTDSGGGQREVSRLTRLRIRANPSRLPASCIRSLNAAVHPDTGQASSLCKPSNRGGCCPCHNGRQTGCELVRFESLKTPVRLWCQCHNCQSQIM